MPIDPLVAEALPRLRQLIEQWRERSKRAAADRDDPKSFDVDGYYTGAESIAMCADELEQILSAGGSAPLPPNEKQLQDQSGNRARAESLWEQLGGDLCICQRPDVPHWCEKCQHRIDLITAELSAEDQPHSPLDRDAIKALFQAGWDAGFQEALRPDDHPDQDRMTTAFDECADHLLRLVAEAGGSAPRVEPLTWHPIETAPKMRTVLLFAVTDVGEDGTPKNHHTGTGFWHQAYENHERMTPWNWGGYQLTKGDVQPTHWTPLPAPPNSIVPPPEGGHEE